MVLKSKIIGYKLLSNSKKEVIYRPRRSFRSVRLKDGTFVAYNVVTSYILYDTMYIVYS